MRTIKMKMRYMLENRDNDDGTSSQMMPYRYTYISYLPCVETKERAAPITAGRKNFMMLLDYLQLTCTKENCGGLMIIMQ